MAVTPIGLAAQSTGKVTTQANGAMGKSDFLAMLVAEMKQQDPLNPMDNTQMVAQMAQFSSLEQMTNMSESFSSLQAVSLLGREVTASAASGGTITGQVTGVSVNGGTPLLTLKDGSIVALQDVQNVTFATQ